MTSPCRPTPCPCLPPGFSAGVTSSNSSSRTHLSSVSFPLAPSLILFSYWVLRRVLVGHEKECSGQDLVRRVSGTKHLNTNYNRLVVSTLSLTQKPGEGTQRPRSLRSRSKNSVPGLPSVLISKNPLLTDSVRRKSSRSKKLTTESRNFGCFFA